MSDDKTKKLLDSKFISMKEDYEVTYWTKKYGVTKAQLQAVIDKIGNAVSVVDKHYGK
ncbi:MAG: DUF3606 domain-containing protein [Pseudomonadota bacterium]